MLSFLLFQSEKLCASKLANKLSLETFLETLLLFASTKQMCSKYMQTFTDLGASLDKEVQIVVDYCLRNVIFTASTSSKQKLSQSHLLLGLWILN